MILFIKGEKNYQNLAWKSHLSLMFVKVIQEEHMLQNL